MAARAALQALVQDDPELARIGVQEVYGTNSVDTPEEEMFIIIRWDNTTQAFKTIGSDQCSIWVHDRQRDYGRINAALERLKNLVTDAVHVMGDDGWKLTTAEWNGEGPDLVDTGFNTITRFADFTVVSRYTTT